MEQVYSFEELTYLTSCVHFTINNLIALQSTLKNKCVMRSFENTTYFCMCDIQYELVLALT